MATSSLTHAKSSGSTLYAVLSLNVLQSLDHDKILALNEIGIFSLGDLLHFGPILRARLLMVVSRREVGHDINLERYLDNNYLNKLPSELPDLKIRAIEGLGEATEEVFNKKFGIVTIRELAMFSPFLEAQSYLKPDDEVFNEPASAPEDLMPKIIGSTSSIARYSNFVMDEEIRMEEGIFMPKELVKTFPNPELATLFQSNQFQCFVGYVAGFKQSWINMGTHLGEVIHSLALAPGESTNIAFVQHRRQLRSSREEQTMVDEQLMNSLTHNRALDEVTRVTAKEHQSGLTNTFNNTVSTANSESKGLNIGGSSSAVADLEVAGFPVKVGSQTAGSRNSGSSSVYSNNSQVGVIQSSSSGNRDIVGEMSQNITDSTLQNSSNIRSLWSTVVVTDEQTAQENIQTRNVTNYNHSHALSVLYYEMLQEYCVKLQLDNWFPILYLPFKPLSFNLEIISKYWHLLKFPLQRYFPEKFEKFNPIVTEPLSQGLNGVEDKTYKVKKIKIVIAFSVDQWYRYLDTTFGGMGQTQIENQAYPIDMLLTIFINSGAPVLQFFNQPVKEHIVDVNLDSIEKIFIAPTSSVFNKPPINLLSEIKIDITINYTLEDDNGGIQVVTKLYNKNISYGSIYESSTKKEPILLAQDIGKAIAMPSSEPAQSNLSLIKEIEDHFNQTRYGYTRFLISSIEKEQLIDIVENLFIGIEGQGLPKRLINYVYPASIGVSDNFLIFKFKKKPLGATSNNPFWTYVTQVNETLEKKKNEPVKCEDAFLPTSGVFAEAILGRSNASEFVNPRRFWNWQDSPIPNLAPQIAPIQAGNHVFTDPGGVLNPNVPTSNLNIINPPQYALPTSLDSALQAIQNGNMFRDMSKSGEMVSILGKLADLANNTAQVSGNLTGQAAENALKGALELGKQVAGMMNNASSILGKSANTTPSPRTPTEKAAALNNLDDIQKNSTSGGSPTPIDLAKAEAMGTPINKGGEELASNDPLYIPSSSSSSLSQLEMGEILKSIGNFKSSSIVSPWVNLDRQSIADRLLDLIYDPDIIAQGPLNLCGPAAFFNTWIKDDLKSFAGFVIDLYDKGESNIGKLKIAGEQDLFNVNYDFVKSSYEAKFNFPPFPPKTDWMIMISLIASTNWLQDHEGSAPNGTIDELVEGFTGLTWPSFMKTWLENSETYDSVSDETNLAFSKSIDHGLQLFPQKGKRSVIMLINSSMLSNSKPTFTIPTHWIALLSNPVLYGEKVYFHAWTWSKKTFYEVDKDVFEDCYFGAIIANH